MRASAPRRAVAVAAGLVVVAAVVAGLMVLGTPADERSRQVDARRVSDLLDIERGVTLHWRQQAADVRRLPASLDALSRAGTPPVRQRDPITGEPYGYRVLSVSAYELCATFDGDSTEPLATPRRDTWSHGPGRQCFRLEVFDSR